MKTVEITQESALDALLAFGKEKNPHKRAALYAKDISPRMEIVQDIPIYAANSVGTLAGTLVTQRTLELLKLQFPLLRLVCTDFSEEQAKFNQVIQSRIIGLPSTADYDPTTGYAATDMTSSATASSPRGRRRLFSKNWLRTKPSFSSRLRRSPWVSKSGNLSCTKRS